MGKGEQGAICMVLLVFVPVHTTVCPIATERMSTVDGRNENVLLEDVALRRHRLMLSRLLASCEKAKKCAPVCIRT